MAGEPNTPPRPPGIRPPPLLFQFPTLMPQPIWSVHPPQQQHHQQQQQQQQPVLAAAAPQSLELPPQMPFFAIPAAQQQQQQRFLGEIPPPPLPQQQHDRGGSFGGNLNFHTPSLAPPPPPPPPPDLNRPAAPPLFFQRKSPQQMVFVERAGVPVDQAQTTFLQGTPPPPPPTPAAPAAAEEPEMQAQKQQQQEELLLDLSKRQLSSKNEARQTKRSKRMEMPAAAQAPGGHILESRRVYPAPLADHHNVVADEALFLVTLTKFYEAVSGTQLRLPRLKDKEFEIHRLYCEVTEQGGMLKVTRETKWKEIAKAFDLPRMVTNPVFFLRKNYEKFLHHYEQVYFHKKVGEHIPPPDALPMPAPVSSNIEDQAAKLNIDSIQEQANPASSLGHTVTGSIEGKFEHGYFVTVVVGSEKLRGVIYSVPETLEEQEQFADVKNNALESPHLLTPHAQKPGELKIPRTRKSNRKRRKIEGIKSARNGYNFFVAEQRQKLRGGRDEKSKIIGDLWSNLSEKEKEPYVEMSKKDRERYNREVEEKKQRELRGCDEHFDSGVVEDDGNDDKDGGEHPVDGDRNKPYDVRYNTQATNNQAEKNYTLDRSQQQQAMDSNAIAI